MTKCKFMIVRRLLFLFAGIVCLVTSSLCLFGALFTVNILHPKIQDVLAYGVPLASFPILLIAFLLRGRVRLTAWLLPTCSFISIYMASLCTSQSSITIIDCLRSVPVSLLTATAILVEGAYQLGGDPKLHT